MFDWNKDGNETVSPSTDRQFCLCSFAILEMFTFPTNGDRSCCLERGFYHFLFRISLATAARSAAWVVWVCIIFKPCCNEHVLKWNTWAYLFNCWRDHRERERERSAHHFTSATLDDQYESLHIDRSVCPAVCAMVQRTSRLFISGSLSWLSARLRVCALLLSAHKTETCDIATAISISISDFCIFPLADFIFIYIISSRCLRFSSRGCDCAQQCFAHTPIKWKK